MSATLHDGIWELTPSDQLLVEAKRWGSRLRFAVMLLFYRARGRFPRAAEVDEGAVADLARGLSVPVPGDGAALLPGSDEPATKPTRVYLKLFGVSHAARAICSRASAAVGRAAVRAGLDKPLGVLPTVRRGKSNEPETDAAEALLHGSAVSTH